MTRAERNHNPLNIRLTHDKWVGRCSEQTDKEFVQFTSDLYGFRSAFRIIHNGFRYGRNTIRKIVSRWAPPNENNTDNYVRYISDMVSVSPDEVLNYDNLDIMSAIVLAMAKMESGKWYSSDIVIQAYYLELGKEGGMGGQIVPSI